MLRNGVLCLQTKKDFKPISEVGIEMFAGTTVNAPSFFFIQFNFFLKIIFFNDVYIHVYWKPNIIVLKCLRQQRLPFWILGYISYTVHRVYIYNKFIECTCTTNLQSVHVQQTVYVQQTCRMYMYNKHRLYVYNKLIECMCTTNL